jgi:predicted acyltransferase
LLFLGSALTFLFLVLRGLNAYGNPGAGVAASSPGEWHPLAAISMTIVYFLDVEKYPPSLQFLLMTIGPSLLLLCCLDRFGDKPFIKRLTNPLLVFGRVPMFFYILHLYVIHLLAIAVAYIFRQSADWLWHGSFWMNNTPEGYGHGLSFVYMMWLFAVGMLYFPCRWFAKLKRRRKDWWLGYF